MLKSKNNLSVIGNNLTNTEKKIHSLNRVHYLPGTPVGIFLVICFIASDFLFIKQLVDAYFTQSVYMVFAASAVIACLIDISPSILAGCISVKKKKPVHYAGMVLTCTVLIASFAVLALIRINSSDLIYQTAGNQITSLVSAQDVVQNAHEEGAGWMTVLCSIMPVFTSIVSFLVGIFENAEDEEVYIKKVAAISNKEKLFEIEANNLELELELERDLNGVNEKQRALELDDVESKKKITKELIKLEMAKAVGTPQALTNFMEEF